MKFPPALTLTFVLLLPGCGNVHNLAAKSRAKKERERIEKLTAASADEAESRLGRRAVGEITSVSPDQQFVLLKPLVGVVIPTGTELESRRGNSRTGLLRVTPEKKSLFTIADLIEGAPQNGDAIFALKSKAPTSPAPLPPEVLAGQKSGNQSAESGQAASARKQGTDSLLPPPVLGPGAENTGGSDQTYPSAATSNGADIAPDSPAVPARGKGRDDDFDPTDLPPLPKSITKPEDVQRKN